MAAAITEKDLSIVPSGNRFLYDWVSLTSKIHSVVEMIDLLGLSGLPFETLTGSHGFRWRQYFSGISIHFNEDDLHKDGDPDVSSGGINAGWIWVEMSGQGCRAFETYGHGDFDKLFNLVLDNPGNVRLTRLDVAHDDMSGVLDINTICDYTRLKNFVSRSRTYESIYGSKGNSVTFGSKCSNVLIRIYDKARERGFTVDEVPHWVRCEIMLKDENAMGFISLVQTRSINELYCGTLKNYLSFREPSETDTNKRRWEECEWWTRFINDTAAVSLLDKPGVDYNLSKCEKYVLTQPVGSIKTLIKIHGIVQFLAMLESVPPPKNPKYQRLINECLRMDNQDSVIKAIERDLADQEFYDEIYESMNEVRRLHEVRVNEHLREQKRQATYAHYQKIYRELGYDFDKKKVIRQILEKEGDDMKH